jgi:hypothetical protein
MVSDNAGNQWRFYPGGWFQQQGARPVYSQAAMLTINGNQVNSNTNVAKVDEKTGEIIFAGLVGQGVTVTRRILMDKESGYVRYVEVIKNTTGQEQTIQTRRADKPELRSQREPDGERSEKSAISRLPGSRRQVWACRLWRCTPAKA